MYLSQPLPVLSIHAWTIADIRIWHWISAYHHLRTDEKSPGISGRHILRNMVSRVELGLVPAYAAWQVVALCHGCPDCRRTHHHCRSYHCYYHLPFAAPSLLLSPETAGIYLLEGSGRSSNFIPSVLPPKDFKSSWMLYRSNHEVDIMFKSSQASHVIPLTNAPPIEVGPAVTSLSACVLPRCLERWPSFSIT